MQDGPGMIMVSDTLALFGDSTQGSGPEGSSVGHIGWFSYIGPFVNLTLRAFGGSINPSEAP